LEGANVSLSRQRLDHGSRLAILNKRTKEDHACAIAQKPVLAAVAVTCGWGARVDGRSCGANWQDVEIDGDGERLSALKPGSYAFPIQARA
jgi:hypothetical protein